MLKKIVYVVAFALSLSVVIGYGLWKDKQAFIEPVVKKDDEARVVREEIERDDFCPKYTRPEVGVKANLSFKAFDYDLKPRYFSAEDLKKMAAEDERMLKVLVREGGGFNNNTYEHGFGDKKFTVVRCSSRYSIDPKSAGVQGWIRESMQLPNGQWIRGLPAFATVFYEGGKTHILTYRRICEFVDEKTLRIVVSADDGSANLLPIHWEGAYLGHQYINVVKAGTHKSSFGGLLEHKDKGWVFHSYSGQTPGYNLRAKIKGEKIVLTFDTFSAPAKKSVEFDREAGTFRDMQ